MNSVPVQNRSYELEKWKIYMKQESVKDGSTERMKQENEQYCITFIFRQ